jgi:hypothetical protein
MIRYNPLIRFAVGNSLSILLLSACVSPSPTTSNQLPATNPQSPAPSPQLPTPTPSDSGWVSLDPGLDRREIVVPFTEQGFAERLILFRIDPAFFTFRVRYSPGFPRYVSEWATAARLVFNAGYFDENNAALGLLVSDGRSFGASYRDLGGMFSVVGGQPNIRSLIYQPYELIEPLEQAVQSFPTLIYPDGSPFNKEDNVRSRRTAVGQDAEGRVYLVIAPHTAFTLAELAAWLHASDLGLTIALNLDGGGSTGYSAGGHDQINSLVPIPAVIAVYPQASPTPPAHSPGS